MLALILVGTGPALTPDCAPVSACPAAVAGVPIRVDVIARARALISFGFPTLASTRLPTRAAANSTRGSTWPPVRRDSASLRWGLLGAAPGLSLEPRFPPTALTRASRDTAPGASIPPLCCIVATRLSRGEEWTACTPRRPDIQGFSPPRARNAAARRGPDDLELFAALEAEVFSEDPWTP